MTIRPAWNVHIGDQIRITGPSSINGRATWRPGIQTGWQPRAYTAPPGSSPSYRVYPDELFIDFSSKFTVLAVCYGRLFVSVLVQVPDGYGLRSVWINVAKGGQSWAVILRQDDGERHHQ